MRVQDIMSLNSAISDACQKSHGWVEVTTLWLAALRGYVDTLRVLVEGGADINKATNAGSTPLQIATDNQHPQIIHLLELAAQV
jgi:hypothetical protein